MTVTSLEFPVSGVAEFVSEFAIADDDFRFFADLAQARFGIHLTEQKRSLVTGRLLPLLREKALPDFHAYRLRLESRLADEDLDDLANHLSTNHTFFFREPSHFEFLRRTALPEMRARHARDRDLRIWCAAASTGEEPYSILMTAMEFFGADYANWKAGVLATDLSARALSAARAGAYPEDRIQNVPEALLQKYFFRDVDGLWVVKDFARAEITCRRFNLINARFPFQQPFDVIFCRNVMIYFDLPTRDSLLRKLAAFLVPGGHLIVGHSESLGRGYPEFQYLEPAIYRRTNG